MEAKLESLTKNGIANICLPDDYEYTGSEKRVFQIVDVKDFSNDASKKTVKMRLKLSDGYCHCFCLIKTDVFDKMLSVKLTLHDIVELAQFKKQTLNGKKTLLVALAPLRVLKSDLCESLGESADFDFRKTSDMLKDIPVVKPVSPAPKRANGITQRAQTRVTSDYEFTPIMQLSNFKNDFSIKVRVTKKKDPFMFNRAKSQSLMNIELIDERGD